MDGSQISTRPGKFEKLKDDETISCTFIKHVSAKPETQMVMHLAAIIYKVPGSKAW